ncbi:MAG TPA: hypothetical protein VFA84_10895 [Acidimicrobiales bacterium]|nr:hypothetical protein [Acidimicrobiales bacterium]
MQRGAWIHSPARDAALAFCWVPFAVAAVAVQGHRHLLAGLLSAVLVLSLSHQPVTLALVYGDAGRFRDHRRIYGLGPLVALAVVLFGLRVSLLLVAIVAGLWNAEHTLMQRYGVTRLYGRKAGDDHGGLERPMLFSWLGVALVAAAANPRTPRYLAQVDLGDVNRRGITFLTRFRPEAAVLLVPALAVAGVLTARWVRAERAAATANPAKWLYVGATAALVLAVCVDPVAGFAAYVGAHAVEYFVIVHGAAGRRASRGEGGAVGRVVRSPLGATGFVAVAAVGALVPLMALARAGSFTVAEAAYLTVGALHIFYDGLIWKQRVPSVAADLRAFAGAG